VEVPAENEIMIPDNPPSKSPSPTGQVLKHKVNLEINPAQDIGPVAPSDAPLD